MLAIALVACAETQTRKESVMDTIDVVAINDQLPQKFEEENISGILLPATRHTSASIAIVSPGEAQTAHVQNRPDNGAEVILVFEGTFELVSEGRVVAAQDVSTDGPVYVSIPSGSEAYFRNVGSKPLRMFSVFAPPFAAGEITYSKK